MRRINEPRKLDLFVFDSMTELAAFVNPDHFHPRKRSFVGEHLADWAGVLKRTTRDWAEGMYILNEFVQKLRSAPLPEIKSHKRQVRFNDHDGDEIDYDRLRNGQDFWRKSEREETTGPTTVTVVIDTTTAANVASDDILWRGAAAIALTQILEEKGYTVELWVANGSQLYNGESTRVLTSCCLKRTSDPLDPSTLINTVAGWFYRTVTFTLLDTLCQKAGKGVAWGYGCCAEPMPHELDHLSRDANRVYASGVFSFNGALSMIQAELEKIAAHQAQE